MEWSLNTGIGKTGVVLAALVAIAMCVLSLIYHPVEIAPIQYGLCLPSPDSWNIDPIWSWAVNAVLIGLISLLAYLINKSYNFIRTTEPVFQALFLIMACSSPWYTQSINTSVLLCVANVVCMGIIFGTYKTRNATQQMFTLGIVVGIGSMFQYAFLPMAFVYLLWSLFMKVLRVKETLAFIIGILCPYWIILGIGWLHISDFHFPSITPLFTLTGDFSDFFVLLAGIALAAVIGFIVTLINSIKLYAGNSKVNAMNLCISTLGAACVVCIIVDYDNIMAYVTSLYLACALQMGNICALWNPKMPWLVSALPAACYVGIFVCSMIF
ncbi:MAG: hypothetical protein J1E16_09370 [Muribaculaceae bacterium]|nr:hypothetical protein [Muribaculaceae bacterium]